ncbi:putative serine/threonine protein kinase [Namao virus]|nr:putative serine/threonine protein kinase [Namao virus]
MSLNSEFKNFFYQDVSYRKVFIDRLIVQLEKYMGVKNLSLMLEKKDIFYFINLLRQKINVSSIVVKNHWDMIKFLNQCAIKIYYTCSGSTGHIFKGIYHDETDLIEKKVAIKIVPYMKKTGVKIEKRSEHSEILILRLFSYLVLSGKTPHIILPIVTFNTSMDTLLTICDQPKTYYEHISKNQEFLEKEASVLIYEWADGSNLMHYICQNYKIMTLKVWSIFLFQIIFTLAKIHKYFPNFRHNDLKANNILIRYNRVAPPPEKETFLYYLDDLLFYVPNIGIQLFLWDFDFACIPGLIDNDKVEAEWTSKVNMHPIKNQYYDLHFFIYNLTNHRGVFKEKYSSLWDCEYVPCEVKSFLRRIVPKMYESEKYVYKNRIMIDIEHSTPLHILKTDAFFNKMRPALQKLKTCSDHSI